MQLRPRRSAGVVLAIGFMLAPALAPAAIADAPAVDDVYVMNEDGTLTVDAPGVLANDALSAEMCVVGVDVDGLEGRLLDKGNTGWRTDGWFTFTPWATWNGETSFVYGMKTLENGECTGPALGQGTVRISVRSVNDPPTAVVAGSCDGGVTVAQDSGPYDDPSHCVENHNWGPVDEVTQQLAGWVVTTDHPELFAAGPSISVAAHAFGELHFTPAAGAHGVASVSVRARDDGGTAHGGNDLSAAVSFALTVTATADPSASPTTATEVPSVEPASSDGGGAIPTPTAAPTTPPAESPTSAPLGDGPILLIGLFLVLVLVVRIVVPRSLRRARRAAMTGAWRRASSRSSSGCFRSARPPSRRCSTSRPTTSTRSTRTTSSMSR